MNTVLTLLGSVFWVVSFVCSIIILIDAFKNEIWKGIVSLLCGLYMLYYAFAEFQHEKKTLILVGWLLGGLVGTGIYMAGAFSGMASGAPPLTP